jgi:FAD/FMN-containing dehydrogenase
MVDKYPVFSRQDSTSHELSIEKIRSTFQGTVIAPEDPEYETARTAFYGGIDNHPAVIIRPRNSEEVRRVIDLARETGMDLSVRSGGHSVVGHSIADGGIMLDLSDMRDLQINVEDRTAWAEAGLTAGEYTTAAAAHGLATGFGDTGSVGIGGITLGGGVGYLVRKYGLTIDDLLAAEVVTADGQILKVDEKNHPDLFWAIRGGGGNFGVVTRFKFRLHDVTSVYGGMLFLPATPENITSFITLAESAPEELSSIANVMGAPPMPFIPAEYHGKMIIMVMLIYIGDAKAGEQAIAPFRSIATPIMDMIKPMSYPEIYPPEDESYHPIGASRNMFVDSIDRSMAKMILDRLESSTAMMKVAQLRVLGGAMARIPSDATAFAHRNSKIMVNLAGLYQQPEDKEKHEAWVSDFASALEQSDHGVYVNFLGDEGTDRVRAAYPGPTWDRLVAVKTRYDPTNLFHLNQNIPPLNGQ